MKLNEYFNRINDRTRRKHLEDMADNLGVSLTAIYHWRRGTRIPRPYHLKRIEEITNGKVKFNDFVN